MVLQSTRWLALSYFTYFFSYGIFLPFWGVWLKGEGIAPETIGILLGAGLVARFLGSLLIAPRVKDPSHLVSALRLLALLTLAFAVGFCFGNGWGWLMLVIAGFNLFFSPLVPLTDALAATWQKQIRMDYGRVRLWGSLAFVIGSALTGQLVAVWGHNAILYSLIFSVLAMLLGMLLKPSVMPQGEARTHSDTERSLWALLKEGPVWRFLLCVTLLQGAHAGYYSFGSIYWQEAGYSASTIGVLLRDALHRRQQRRQVLDVGGVGADGVEQRLTLIAVALVAHVENIFQFRVMREHAIVKVGGQLRPGRSQQGNGGFHGGDGLAIQHGSAP